MKQKRECGKMSNKKLIINADDFGYTSAVTQGIIEAHKRVVVTSTTALPTSPYFLESMECACIRAPSLAIGFH
ncbi:ChbG/HpnK family deacetylase, partial [Enterococcus faecalis]|uniref:ChbG/HpnK family deacetylase n=1 Tax=Enterococcus faecalis TaxID=1351 RepID=UPI003D6BBEFD